MKILNQLSLPMKIFLFAVVAIGLAVLIIPRTEFYHEWFFEGRRRSAKAK